MRAATQAGYIDREMEPPMPTQTTTPLQERIDRLLELLSVAEGTACEVIAEIHALRRALRRVRSLVGHSGGEESAERDLAVLERRAAALASAVKARRDEVVLGWGVEAELRAGVRWAARVRAGVKKLWKEVWRG
jgi:hypothetical protein